jgi:hypothetical protein
MRHQVPGVPRGAGTAAGAVRHAAAGSSTTAAGYSEIGSALERTGGQIETTGYKAATAKAALAAGSGDRPGAGRRCRGLCARLGRRQLRQDRQRRRRRQETRSTINRSLRDMGNAERIDAHDGVDPQLRDELADARRPAAAAATRAASFLQPARPGGGEADYMRTPRRPSTPTRTPSPSSRCSRPLASDTADMLTGSMGMSRSEICVGGRGGHRSQPGLRRCLRQGCCCSATRRTRRTAPRRPPPAPCRCSPTRWTGQGGRRRREERHRHVQAVPGHPDRRAHQLAEAQSAMYAALDDATSQLTGRAGAIATRRVARPETEAGRKGPADVDRHRTQSTSTSRR